ncbi:MAG: Branched-chain amino acid transport system 2 carrier protein [Chlamydiae bacterium]|nr:Branched-chain amino acid transport system 2 carrier protein [Chlamydiota bacterium]
MKIDKQSSAFIIGMALFAMFFGSGNLIYPLYLGQVAQGSWPAVMLGFLIAAVIVPFLGVIAIVLYKGSYSSFFNTIGRRGGFLLSSLLLTVWIPFGSAPRCITVAYASINSYFNNPPALWIFSLVYGLLVFYIIKRKLGILDILGRFITPLLLVCLAFVCIKGFIEMPQIAAGSFEENFGVLQGLTEGYNTMDLIASFFFSASVIHILNKSGSKMSNSLSLVVRSSIVGMSLLAVVYVCLISLAAHNSAALAEVPKDQLLPYLAQTILGPTWSFAAILAIILACFSTSIALIVAYTDFLHDEVFKQNQHPNVSSAIALVVTFVMSLTGLEGITFVTAPVLKVCYPILIVLILFNIGRIVFKREGRELQAERGMNH